MTENNQEIQLRKHLENSQNEIRILRERNKLLLEQHKKLLELMYGTI